MNTINSSFESQGYAILEKVLSDNDIVEITRNLDSVTLGKAGTRNLIFYDWCTDLARSLKLNPRLTPLLSEDLAAVPCTYFEKSLERNWLVTLHRDYSIPVKRKIDASGWSVWSTKEGVQYVRPPESVLKSLIAIRLHLEDNTEQNSPLQVVPGSHEETEPSNVRVNCLVSKGGALIMRPLLLHASSRITKVREGYSIFLWSQDTSRQS